MSRCITIEIHQRAFYKFMILLISWYLILKISKSILILDAIWYFDTEALGCYFNIVSKLNNSRVDLSLSENIPVQLDSMSWNVLHSTLLSIQQNNGVFYLQPVFFQSLLKFAPRKHLIFQTVNAKSYYLFI